MTRPALAAAASGIVLLLAPSASGSISTSAVFDAVAPAGSAPAEADLARAALIVRNRLARLAPTSDVQRDGRRFVIRSPHVLPGEVLRAATQPGLLEFYDLEARLTGPSISRGFPVAQTSLYALLAKVQAPAGRAPGAYYLFGANRRLLAGPVEARARLPKVPEGGKVLAVPAKTVVITCGRPAVICPGVNESPPSRTYWYLLRHDPALTSDDVRLTGTREDLDPSTGDPIVLLDFTAAGRRKLHDVTRAEAVRGKRVSARLGRDEFQHFAIVLDGRLMSFPSIDFHSYPQGIDPINGAQITGFSEGRTLAAVLRWGSLPVRLVRVG